MRPMAGHWRSQESLDLVGLRPQGDIHVSGRGLAMNIPEGVRTELDTDLTLTVSADDLALNGTVTVLRARTGKPSRSRAAYWPRCKSRSR